MSLFFPLVSQPDSTNKKNGFSIFAGIGAGGNNIKQGFSRGIAVGYHYRIHAFDMYVSRITKREAIRTKDLELTLDNVNYGLLYGVGMFNDNFSAALVGGIGYSHIVLTIPGDPNATPWVAYVTNNYSKFGACAGVQAEIKGRVIGFSGKFYYNIFDQLSTYSLLVGVQMTFTR